MKLLTWVFLGVGGGVRQVGDVSVDSPIVYLSGNGPMSWKAAISGDKSGCVCESVLYW